MNHLFFWCRTVRLFEFIQEYKKRYNTVALVRVRYAAGCVTSAGDAGTMFHDVVAKIRRSTKRTGVSVSLTYMLALLEQCLERI